MQKKNLVLGLFSSADDASMAIDNLTEVEIPEHMISVVAKDTEAAKELTNHPGKYTGAFSDSLADRLGIPADNRSSFASGVASGNVLVVVETGEVPEDVVEEMLRDNRAQTVLVTTAL